MTHGLGTDVFDALGLKALVQRRVQAVVQALLVSLLVALLRSGFGRFKEQVCDAGFVRLVVFAVVEVGD